MNINKEEKKIINELVTLYFKYNPNMNKGMGFRIKANDVIKEYYITHKKSYEDIKQCIESKPMCQVPIWNQFKNYFYKKKEEKSEYKNSIGESLNPDDWF
jgi:hypothetical protein